LPKVGSHIDALFQVDGKEVKIGIADTLRGIWNINPEKEVELALKQIGELKISLMLIKGEELKDCIFKTYDFEEDDRTLTFDEAIEKFKKEILKADEQKKIKKK